MTQGPQFPPPPSPSSGSLLGSGWDPALTQKLTQIIEKTQWFHSFQVFCKKKMCFSRVCCFHWKKQGKTCFFGLQIWGWGPKTEKKSVLKTVKKTIIWLRFDTFLMFFYGFLKAVKNQFWTEKLDENAQFFCWKTN